MLPDGRFGFSGGWGRTIRVWDLSAVQCLRTLEGHRAHVTCLDCSPDGRWMMSAGEDGEVRLWELAWDYEFPGWAEWTEGLDSAVTTLLARYDVRPGSEWNQEIYCRLLFDLQSIGYGWLRAEAVYSTAQRYLDRPSDAENEE
jgi:WD40 repeat protein